MAGPVAVGAERRTRAGTEPGAFCHLRLSANRRDLRLSRAWAARQVFACADRLEAERRAEVHFCIVLPDGVHAVFRPLGRRTPAQVVGFFRQRTTRWLDRRSGRRGRLWRARATVRELPGVAVPLDVIRYCWYSPVRAGLVNRPADYPFWRSRHPLT